MMTKNKSKSRNIVKQFLTIPLFIGFAFTFSSNLSAQDKEASKELITEYESKLHKEDGTIVVNSQDIERLYLIYNLMSDSQKKTATKIPLHLLHLQLLFLLI